MKGVEGGEEERREGSNKEIVYDIGGELKVATQSFRGLCAS